MIGVPTAKRTDQHVDNAGSLVERDSAIERNGIALCQRPIDGAAPCSARHSLYSLHR